MAISYNTGTTSTVTAGGTSGTVTIPAGVLNGDTILVLVTAFTTATGSPTLALSSTATTPVAQGTLQNTGANGGIQTLSQVFSIAAGSSDPSATLTYSASGGSGGSYWWDVGLVSYTGAGGVDVITGTNFFNASSVGTTTTPSATTVTSGDWQVQLLGVAPPNGANFTVPGTLTGRQAITSATNAGILLNIADSNGSVGAGGTGIGNTTWTCSGAAASNTWSTSFTVGLSLAGGGGATAPAVNRARPGKTWQRRYHHQQLALAPPPPAPPVPPAGSPAGGLVAQRSPAHRARAVTGNAYGAAAPVPSPAGSLPGGIVIRRQQSGVTWGGLASSRVFTGTPPAGSQPGGSVSRRRPARAATGHVNAPFPLVPPNGSRPGGQVCRRRPARAVWDGLAATGIFGGTLPRGSAPGGLVRRRTAARAVTGHGYGTVAPPVPKGSPPGGLVKRRTPARAVQAHGYGTVAPPAPNGTLQPHPAVARRATARACAHWIPVTTTNAPPPPFTVGALTASDQSLGALGGSDRSLAALTATDEATGGPA